MENTGYCGESFNSLQSGTSDEDMVEIAGATLDFSSTDDVPPLDRDYSSGKSHISPCDQRHQLCALCLSQWLYTKRADSGSDVKNRK